MTEIHKMIGTVFSPIIGPEGTYLFPSLLFHQGLELMKLTESFLLGLWKIDPSLAREVINENHIL